MRRKTLDLLLNWVGVPLTVVFLVAGPRFLSQLTLRVVAGS